MSWLVRESRLSSASFTVVNRGNQWINTDIFGYG